jgi:hypothetical protein
MQGFLRVSGVGCRSVGLGKFVIFDFGFWIDEGAAALERQGTGYRGQGTEG